MEKVCVQIVCIVKVVCIVCIVSTVCILICGQMIVTFIELKRQKFVFSCPQDSAKGDLVTN